MSEPTRLQTRQGTGGRPTKNTIRANHTIALDPDLRQSIQNYYDAVKDTGITVPDVLRELIMRGLQIDGTEAVFNSTRKRIYRIADEFLIKRAIDFCKTQEKELTMYLRLANEEGRLINDPGDLENHEL
jgi:hypothetical protein